MPTRIRRTRIVLASVLVGAAVVVVVVVTSSGWWSSPDAKPLATATSPAGNTSTPSASTAPTPSPMTPPTTDRPATPTATATPKPRRVQVVTTFAGWNTTAGAVEVGGYAAVVEPVGTCTLRLIHGNQVVTRQHAASADATTVACGGFSVPGSALTPGAWRVALVYTSSTSMGEAPSVSVKVP